MNRIMLELERSAPSFIGAWSMASGELCDGLVQYFEDNQSKHRKGTTGGGVDTEVKNTMDLTVLPKEIELPGNEIFKHYFQWLHGCYKDYLAQWPFFASIAKNLEVGAFNIQSYGPGQHFQKIHTERDGIASLHRVLAWMTYLNDVDESQGGGTYFDHYDLNIQPIKGKTLIWPAEWTHAHRGSVLKDGRKHVITGWIHFTE